VPTLAPQPFPWVCRFCLPPPPPDSSIDFRAKTHDFKEIPLGWGVPRGAVAARALSERVSRPRARIQGTPCRHQVARSGLGRPAEATVILRGSNSARPSGWKRLGASRGEQPRAGAGRPNPDPTGINAESESTRSQRATSAHEASPLGAASASQLPPAVCRLRTWRGAPRRGIHGVGIGEDGGGAGAEARVRL